MRSKRFLSLFTRLVDKKDMVILLDNVSLGRYNVAITNSIIAILNRQSAEIPKKSIAETLNKTAAQAINKIEGKESEVDNATLESYVGEYQLAPNFCSYYYKRRRKITGTSDRTGKT